jgi:hypothetical protein
MVPIDADPKTFLGINNEYCQWSRTKTKHDPCRRFGKDDKKVFYEFFEIIDADPATFQILKGLFTKDKNFVFYDTQKVEGVDPKSFQSMGLGGYGKDGSTVIYGNMKIIGADPETFKVLHEKYCLAYTNALAKDKNNYYSREEIITKRQYFESLKSEVNEIRPILRTCD